MSLNVLPPPEVVENIFIWHQGALGDLLLAGPALAAISRRYSQARITGLGHPERWGLLRQTLPLAAVWDSGEAFWTPLFAAAPLPPAVLGRLAPFQLALIFSPRPRPSLLARFHEAGIPAVHWIPAFPEGGRETVASWQARHLHGLGLPFVSQEFRLVLEGNHKEDSLPELPGAGPWVAIAPGSGHPCKNWPLAHYYEVSRALVWQKRKRVVWLLGPAEAAWLPYLKPLAAAQDFLLLSHLPLARVAAVLSRCQLYIGGDSGLTHLAAVAGTRAVLALFGPTDSQVWAPRGQQVQVLTAACAAAPCASGREITCPEPRCLADLSPATVLAAAVAMLDCS